MSLFFHHQISVIKIHTPVQNAHTVTSANHHLVLLHTNIVFFLLRKRKIQLSAKNSIAAFRANKNISFAFLSAKIVRLNTCRHLVKIRHQKPCQHIHGFRFGSLIVSKNNHCFFHQRAATLLFNLQNCFYRLIVKSSWTDKRNP